MSERSERLLRYNGLTKPQIRELYRRNFLRMSGYVDVAPEKFRRCMRIEKDLEHISVMMRLNHSKIWKAEDHLSR